MNKVPINDPKHWRERAKQARALADEMGEPNSKRKMLRVAADHEELARQAELRLKAGNLSKAVAQHETHARR